MSTSPELKCVSQSLDADSNVRTQSEVVSICRSELKPTPHRSSRPGTPRVVLPDLPDPAHTYVEKIHTPRRHSTPHATDEDWLMDKHAHVDDDAVSPHGYVQRVQTPIGTPKDGATFESVISPVSPTPESPSVFSHWYVKAGCGIAVLGVVVGVCLGLSRKRLRH